MSAPASEAAPHWRRNPLLFAYGGFFVVFAAIAGIVNFTGSARDGDRVISIILEPMSGAVETNIVPTSFRDARESGGHAIADPALIEDSPVGPLPRVARDGRTPMEAYARAYDKSDKRPKIAVVVRGLGVGATNSSLALSRVPADVTLAFIPFAPDLQSRIDIARGAGHEVLIELPMEPFDFPDSDPGPRALLVAASGEENGKRLEWALSRATGYAGVMNLLGGRFLGEETAVEPVLALVAKRGLLFFDNGASSSSVAITSARHVKAPIATGTVILDALQTRAAIDTKLAELEMAARQDGSAIGVASSYPVSVARISEWAENAQVRGFHLVPVSALATVPADFTAAHHAEAPKDAASR